MKISRIFIYNQKNPIESIKNPEFKKKISPEVFFFLWEQVGLAIKKKKYIYCYSKNIINDRI